MPSTLAGGVRIFTGMSLPQIESDINTWWYGDGTVQNVKKKITQAPAIVWNGSGYVVVIVYEGN